MRKLFFVMFLLFVYLTSSSAIFAQRKAVSGAEVTGTFRSYFTGKFKGNYNEILIQALGGNKLRIEMELTYPFEVNGELSANLGIMVTNPHHKTCANFHGADTGSAPVRDAI